MSNLDNIEKLYDMGDLRPQEVLAKLNEVIDRVNELSLVAAKDGDAIPGDNSNS